MTTKERTPMSELQFALMRRCGARPQRSTAELQNTVNSLVSRGWLRRQQWDGEAYVEITQEGARELHRELEARRV